MKTVDRRAARRRRQRAGKVAAATAGLLSLAAASATAAVATPADEADATDLPSLPEQRSSNLQEFMRQQLDALTIPAASAVGEQATRVRAYLDEQARSGRPVDIRSLTYIDVEVPGAGTAGAIMSVADQLEELVVLETESPGGGGQAFVGAMITPSPMALAWGQRLAGSPGFDAATATGDVSRVSYACRDLWFDAEYTSDDHHVYDCWEKWKSNGSNWAYNRYTLFNPANADDPGEMGAMRDATIRTRPWQGYESRVTGGPYNYAPIPIDDCTTYTAGIPLPTGSLSTPFVSCGSSIEPLPNGTVHSMGTDWDGNTTGTKYLDYGFKITTNNSEPIYADYVWMETQWCFFICEPWDPSDYEKWTDAGW